MPARGVVLSPVLVGRDDLLALCGRRLDEAAAGSGELLFVAGEAGIGKTRLLDAAVRLAAGRGFAVASAAAFPGDTQSSAGLLLDLAGDLTRSADPALSQLGEDLSARARAISAADATPADATPAGAAPAGASSTHTTTTPAASVAGSDAHRRRRVLVQDLVDLLVTVQPAAPVLLVLEDLHWADELSLDVLGHLARRLPSRPMLVAGAYRADLDARQPLRALRARLLAQRLAEEIRLPRLDVAQTAALAGGLLGRPAPALLAAVLHERSDGIPLHVEELLAALDQDALAPHAEAGARAMAVPDTVGEAVLSRARQLSDGTSAVASAAAVIGRSFDFDLLTEVTGASPDAVAAALRDLQGAHLVLPGADPVTFDFRHALVRDTLYADTDLPTRRLLHDRVAAAAARRGYPDAIISAHYEQAQRADPAYLFALAAARAATAISAHSEALELYRRAVRNLPAEVPPMDGAALYTALGDAAAASDDNEAAAQAYRTARDLATGAGEVRAAAALVPGIVAAEHLLGDCLADRVGLLQAALDSLDGVTGAGRERARLHSAMSAAYMLDRRLDEALRYVELARAESQQIGDEDANLSITATLGATMVFAGRLDEGWPLLEDSIARARGEQREASAARGYRMAGCTASVAVEYDRAERYLTEGRDYAEQVELWNHRHYTSSHLAHVQWATGAWDRATRTAQHALADGRGGITTQIVAQYVLGYLAMGRADTATAASLLGQALAQGEQMAELERWSPPLWGLAEVALSQGDHATAQQLCERGYQVSAAVTDAVCLFPYLVTGVRAYLAGDGADAAGDWLDRVGAVLAVRGIPGTLPAIDHGRGLILLARGDLTAAGQALQSARAAWQARRRFWEGTWVLLDLAEVTALDHRRADAALLVDEARTAAAGAGAQALTDAADRLVTTYGGTPGRPWHPLSSREYEVATLVADGLTNRQIAERLVLSPKTIAAHIANILAKLGAGRRAEIARWCATVQRAGQDRS